MSHFLLPLQQTLFYIQTAILRPIRAYLALLGVPVLIYIDDILIGGRDEKTCIQNVALTRKILAQAGFVISASKSQSPRSRITFLGLEMCSMSLAFYIPDIKLEKIIQFIQVLLCKKTVKLRSLAKFTGLIISCFRALGPVSRLHLRNTYHFLSRHLEHHTYNYHVPLSEEVIGDLLFWNDNLRELNGHPIEKKLSCTTTRMTMVSDSSEEGAFVYFVYHDNFNVLVRQAFTTEERTTSSTHRELLALQFTYRHPIIEKLRGHSIVHLTDNQAVSEICAKGSKKPHLQKIALDIYKNCKDYKVTLEVLWRPRSHPLLVFADQGSKSFDQSSYSLDFQSFGILVSVFDDVQISVDCFAEAWNAKCAKYFSKLEDPRAAGTNFFSQFLWQHETYYAFPPPGLISATILHLHQFGVRGLLIIPYWPSCSFWTNVAPDGRHVASWGQQILRFRPSGWLWDSNIRSQTFQNPPSFDIVVIKFDFSNVNDLNVSKVSPTNCVSFGCHRCSA